MAATKIRLSTQALAGSLSLAIVGDGIFTADATGRGKFASGFVNDTLLATDSVTTVKIADLNVTTAKLAANVLSADATGLSKMQDGYLSADASGRAKMADSFVSAAKVLKSDTFDFATAGGTVKVSTPVATTDAANKSYVDSVAAGIDWKQSVRVATTAAGTLATDFENLDTVDGVVLATGNRILIKNQSTGSENGIYVVNASGAPTRASDMASGSSASGAAVFVEEGTTNADSGWVCTSDAGSDVVGTNSLVFTQFTGLGQVTAGAGLTKTGNTLDVGQNSTGAITVNADDIAWNPDNSTLEVSGSGPGTAQLKDGGITTGKFNSSVYAGTGGNFGTLATIARSDHSHAALGGFDVTNEDLTSQVGDGDPTVFTLANSDNVTGSELLFLNGILQRPGASNDYTVAAGSVTFGTAPTSGDVVLISYARS